MKILLFNAGSSSLKAVLAESTSGDSLASALVDWSGSVARYRYVDPSGAEHYEEVSWNGHSDAVRRIVHDLARADASVQSDRAVLSAVGHRVVHGGQFTSSVRITPQIRARISALADLAPLHNPPSLQTLAAAEAELPGVPHIATFDTAFHATLPPASYVYPVPETWTSEWGIRRYGFHGLSHAYCSKRAAEMLQQPANGLRLVICHLGHGCSASAVHGGRSIDTTMGFTPLEGLMMGTRSGSIDPSIVLHVQQHHGLSAQEVENVLNRKSGLLGVSGVSADMRQVIAEARRGNKASELALAIYTHRVRQAIGALAVTLGGIDALVFTAGVGEHSPEIRESVCCGLACLGLVIDSKTNASATADADVAESSSPGRILVIATREDLIMLQEVTCVLTSEGALQ